MSVAWRPALGYEGSYEVSPRGEVRSVASGRVLRLRTDANGYRQVSLSRGGESRSLTVHRLVMEAFDGPRPEGQQIRHLNGKQTDNRVENLAWGSARDNYDDQVAIGTAALGDRHPRAKLTRAEACAILRDVSAPSSKLADELGVSYTLVRRIRTGERWRHLDGGRACAP